MTWFGHHRHNCDDPFAEAPAWAVELDAKLDLIIHQGIKIMSAITDSLDAAEAAAKANSDADDAAEALLVSISKAIADLKTNSTDPATVARITALATALHDRAAKLSAAVLANTPAAT